MQRSLVGLVPLQVLKEITGQPFGIWLLGIIAVGLIAFGIYSLLSAVWLRLKG